MNTLYHLNVVRSVFKEYLSPKAMDIVCRYNFNTDFYGSLGWKIIEKRVYPLLPFAGHWYKRLDHFDQLSGLDEIIETLRTHEKRIMDLADDSLYPSTDILKIFRILGRSSHAISDIPAHTNFVQLFYDYYRTEPAAIEQLKASGKELPEFLLELRPTLRRVLNEPQFAPFKEKYLPKIFSFISVPDSGPTSHSVCNMDKPSSPVCQSGDYPKIFSVVFHCSEREVTDIIHIFFNRIKTENTEKYKAITGAFKDVAMQGEEGPYVRRARWWALKFGGWD